MKPLRNVITLSNLDQQLEEWARKEARRRKKPFYQVVNEALKVYQVIHQTIKEADDGENDSAESEEATIGTQS